MIAEFLASWPLFQTTYLAGWAIAFVLALVGVWVVARNQIFLGVAVSQASALGIAAALWLGGAGASLAWLGSDAAAAALAVAASVATALVASRAGGIGSESSEALTGWVFLAAASAAVLLVAHSAHGLEEVHRLVFSTLLGARREDCWIFAGLGLASAAAVVALRRPLALVALDPEMAAAVGLRRGWWNGLAAVWLGVAVGFAIRASGLIYTFGCLVLPALAAKHLSPGLYPVLVLAPALAVAAAVAGFVLAHHFDTPPAHTTVALLCGAVLTAWGWRALHASGARRGRAAQGGR